MAARTVHRNRHVHLSFLQMVTTEYGKQNILAKEPQVQVLTMDNENAEIQNGRWAMVGFWAAVGAYALTGQIIPGIF